MDEQDLSPDEMSIEELTWREQEVLGLLAERLTNREIGARLHLTENTVKAYVGSILGKLYVKNRRQAVERARSLGLLDQDRQAVVKPQHNLPAEATPFIGRADQLVEISQLLAGTRLLTLTGPGGIGKTRLALQAARGALDEFENGVFFVSLAPIRSGKHIVQTVAEAINFPLSGEDEPIEQLLAHLRKRKLLLVMDNFEHLSDSSEVVSTVLQGAPDVKVLVTSREKLSLQGETVMSVAGMAFPARVPSDDLLGYDAVQLLVQGIRRTQLDFEAAESDLLHLAEICDMAQGMPLAIELAAAWTEVLSLEEIAAELRTGLDILTTEMRDMPKRHRSIRAVFDHSWSLMEAAEREVFARLSVFRGGFTREAAEQAAGASLPLLARLTSKSVLRHDPKQGRFEVHELLRQYAKERLEETPEADFSAHEAHANYYASFMQKRRAHLRDHRQLRALNEIEADIENIRTAWRQRVNDGNASQMQMFVHSFRSLFYVRGWFLAGMEMFREAAHSLRDASPDDEDAQSVRALAQALQGNFMGYLGLSEKGYELAKAGTETLERLDRPLDLALALDGLSLTAYYLMRYDEEEEAERKMLEIATEHNDEPLRAYSLAIAGVAALRREGFAEARQYSEASLAAYETTGDAIGSTMALLGLGHAAHAEGAHEEARRYFLSAFETSERMGYRWAMANSAKYLGRVALAMDDINGANIHLLRSLGIAEEIGLGREIINLLTEFALVRIAEKRLERAVELLTLVSSHPTSHQARLGEGRIRDSAQDLLTEVEAELSSEVYAAAWVRGESLGLDDVVTELLSGHA